MLRSKVIPSLALAIIALLLSTACSDQGGVPSPSTVPEATEQTMVTPETTLEQTDSVGDQYLEETTTETTNGPDPNLVTLRIEGSAGVRFSGSCDFDGTNRPVEGAVPARFVIQTEGSGLSCEIRKASRPGQLRVLITADGRTRSVQQVGVGTGIVSVSYDSA